MRRWTSVILTILGVLVAGCGTDSSKTGSAASESTSRSTPTTVALRPNDTDLSRSWIFVATAPGNTRCGIVLTDARCESLGGDFAPGKNGNPPGDNSNPGAVNKAFMNESGAFTWSQESGEDPDSLAGHSDSDYVLTYDQIYSAAGWTVRPTNAGTTFTNDRTGHGMSISIDNAEVKAF